MKSIISFVTRFIECLDKNVFFDIKFIYHLIEWDMNNKVYNNLYLFLVKNRFCIPESFNTNILHQLLDYNNFCEFTTLEHKFKRWFCTQKPVLIFRFEDFWYKKWIRLRFGITIPYTQHKFLTLNNH